MEELTCVVCKTKKNLLPRKPAVCEFCYESGYYRLWLYDKRQDDWVYPSVVEDVYAKVYGVEGVKTELINDLEVKYRESFFRVGEPLRANEGVDSVEALYETLLDALLYLKKLMLENKDRNI